jgi:prepilin signal peptidase PulO-like enzyme (type II secretory pathway)
LVQDKLDGEPVDKNEFDSLKKLTKTSIINDHSQCLSCSYQLRWYDLIPLFSWLSLKGKCRKCHKQIGFFEPIMELGVAVFFVVSYVFWPYPLDNGLEIARLIIWLVAGVGLSILFVYDKKWFILPNPVSYTLIGIGIVNSFLIISADQDKVSVLLSIVGSALIMSGLYFVLYVISRGKWIGFGDIKLGLGLALLLADWRLAFIALFAANLIGCIIVLPAMIMGKLKRDSHVPFGPMLIAGTVVALFAGNYLVNLYFSFVV